MNTPKSQFNAEEIEVLRKYSSLMNKMDELNFAIQRLTDKLDDAKYATIELNKVADKFDWEKED
jgi:chaperonin cofactor prefoldin